MRSHCALKACGSSSLVFDFCSQINDQLAALRCQVSPVAPLLTGLGMPIPQAARLLGTFGHQGVQKKVLWRVLALSEATRGEVRPLVASSLEPGTEVDRIAPKLLTGKNRVVGNDHFCDTTKRASQRLTPHIQGEIPLYHRSGNIPQP